MKHEMWDLRFSDVECGRPFCLINLVKIITFFLKDYHHIVQRRSACPNDPES
jgi:hypothetical protein